MENLIVLIPALPLLAAIVTAVLGPRVLKSQSHWPVIVAIGASCICSFMLASQLAGQINSTSAENGTAAVGFEKVVTLWNWVNVRDAYRPTRIVDTVNTAASHDLRIDVALRVDALTCIMLCMVTFIGTLIAVYASGYMHGDRGYWRFFAYVSLFVFSMTMLVSVSNFILLFVFWEAVGVCSYLLIGFWYEKPEAAAAGKKAFVVNRIGDFGFSLALFLIWTTYGSLNFHDIDGTPGVLGQIRLAAENGYVAGGLGTAICLLLLLGACGKSAQVPLHVWLPDAMEGPTPVSALIHAATMVTAGVYMVTRCTPLFMASPDAQLVVACVGGITALLAGLIAMTQFDLKRVLAYSTVSQLGYMFLALGTGSLAAICAGMFHLITHAFFKALLFLGAGSVMHSMGNVMDMRRFGGLRKLMPITHATFAVGCLALAGFFPLSGFWSKDAIVANVQQQANEMESELARRGESSGADHENRAKIILASHSTMIASTAGHEADDAHTGHSTSIQPRLSSLSTAQLRRGSIAYKVLYYVALLTAFLTALYTFRAFFLTFYGDEEVPHEAGDHAHESPKSMWVPLVILAVFAAGIGWFFERTHLFAHALMHTPSLSTAKVLETTAPGQFHMDVAITSSVIAIVGIAMAAFFFLGDRSEANFLAKLFSGPYSLSQNKFYFDEIYDALVVWPARLLSNISYAIDRHLVDGLVNLCGFIPKAFGALMRGLQTGLVPFYGLAMVLGMLTILAARFLWNAG